MKKIILALASLLMITVSCKKEKLTSTKEASPSFTSNSKAKIAIQCTPYRNVIGLPNAINELNDLVNCQNLSCPGNFVSTSLYKNLLTDANNNVLQMNTSPSTVLTIAEQVTLINSAKNWANINTPSGYFISYILFIPNIAIGPNISVFDIKVTYSKCTNDGDTGNG